MMRQFLAMANHAASLLAMQTSSSWLPWMPRTASLHAPAIDALMRTSLLALAGLFVLAQCILLAGLFLPRRQHPRFSFTWKWTATFAFAGLMIWMTVVAENLWSSLRLTHAAAGAVQAEVTGMQFQWYFRYPGPDGIYGATRPDLMDAAEGNPLGLDPSDPHGRDDVVSSVLVLPVNRQVSLRLRSRDVVHGFYVPAMRVMQNATPGTPSRIHFTPTRISNYAILCTQLCGLGHYHMHAVLRVVSARDFVAWMAQHEASQQGK